MASEDDSSCLKSIAVARRSIKTIKQIFAGAAKDPKISLPRLNNAGPTALPKTLIEELKPLISPKCAVPKNLINVRLLNKLQSPLLAPKPAINIQ